jgi:diadenylate cyclase
MGDLTQLVSQFNFSAAIDILLVALLFYVLFYLVQGTRAVTLLRGILLLAFVTILASNLLHLTAFNWLVRNSIPALLVAIPVIFQPELRRALERLGRPGALFSPRRASARTPRWDTGMDWLRGLLGLRRAASIARLIDELCTAAGSLSHESTGALIVLEQDTGLQEFVEGGIPLDAKVSTDLLLTIFQHNTRLHDGAVIIHEGRIAAASCVLPLSQNPLLESDLGTRHRAAIGITEETDAIAIVVSEETGQISLAQNGRLARGLEVNELKLLLTSLYFPRPPNGEGEFKAEKETERV